MILKSIILVMAAKLLVACGGGGQAEPAQKVALDGPKQGFITVEERANKRVFDAWFSQGRLESLSGTELWRDQTEYCQEFNTAASLAGSTSLIGSRWQETLDAGDSISIASRGSEVIRLQAQRVAGATLYASTERWLPTALPDDSQLQVAGSEQFPAFNGIAIRPLERLDRSQPENGMLNSPAGLMQWAVSASDDDRIELVVSSSATGAQNPPSVKCWLLDRGQFNLPATVQARFPPNQTLVATLIRTRQMTYESEGAQLHLLQTSYP